jgi:riboflavin kinase, archaea type
MMLALELSFDAAAREQLHSLWVELGRLYPPPGALEIGGEPHVRLAVFRRGEPAHIERVVTALSARLSPFALNLRAVGAFRTDEGVVFLAPDASSELRAAHRQMLQILAGESERVEPYYQPDVWVPHCTVAFNVPSNRLDIVIEACERLHRPLRATVQRLSAVRYWPAVQVCSSELGAAQQPAPESGVLRPGVLRGVVLRGVVRSGRGDFGYWLAKLEPHYRRKTGMKLFPGTLNLELSEPFALPSGALRLEAHEYGGSVSVSIVPCRVFGRRAFILRTDASEQGTGHHPRSLVEIATDVKLRDAHGLVDGDRVDVEI